MSVAPAGVSGTDRGPFFIPPEMHPRKDHPIMTDQPARISPGEISALLDQARSLTPDTPLEERISYHERKAHLLSRIAASLDTAEAHAVAADAWHYVGDLARQRDRADQAQRGARL